MQPGHAGRPEIPLQYIEGARHPARRLLELPPVVRDNDYLPFAAATGTP